MATQTPQGRNCDVCGQTDTLPRHVIINPADTTAEIMRHIACCAKTGCPTKTCTEA